MLGFQTINKSGHTCLHSHNQKYQSLWDSRPDFVWQVHVHTGNRRQLTGAAMMKLVLLCVAGLAVTGAFKMKKSRDLDKKPEFVRRQATTSESPSFLPTERMSWGCDWCSGYGLCVCVWQKLYRAGGLISYTYMNQSSIFIFLIDFLVVSHWLFSLSHPHWSKGS